MIRPSVIVGAALLLALVGTGEVTQPGPPAPLRADSAPVAGTLVVCPEVDGAAVTVGSTGSGAGTLRARTLGGAYAALPVTGAGQVAVVDRSAGAVLVAATGAVAGGLGVEQRSRNLDGQVRGLSAQRCAPAGTSAWFVGGATVVGETAQLVLANPDDSPALVDVTSWSATGPVERRPGRGIVVPARGQTVVEVDTLAPDRELLALHVQTVRGRVAPALRHSRFDGRVPRGTDWVPIAPAPSREVLVPGLPSGPGRRTVVITNPGQDATTVTLSLLTGDGQMDLAPFEVPAGSSVAREVSEELAQTSAAVRVRSDGGVVLAGGFVYDLQDDGAGGVRELAWAGAATALTGPALLADVTLAPSAEVTLLLSAPETDAVAELVALPVVGQDGPLPAPRRVEVPGGTTVALRLSTLLASGATGRLALELRPSGGPLLASRYLRERGASGPLTAVLPVLSQQPRVRRPAVRQDPLAGRPQR